MSAEPLSGLEYARRAGGAGWFALDMRRDIGLSLYEQLAGFSKALVQLIRYAREAFDRDAMLFVNAKMLPLIAAGPGFRWREASSCYLILEEIEVEVDPTIPDGFCVLADLNTREPVCMIEAKNYLEPCDPSVEESVGPAHNED